MARVDGDRQVGSGPRVVDGDRQADIGGGVSLTADYIALVASGLHAIAVSEIQRVLRPLHVEEVGRPPPSDQWAPNGGDDVFPGTAGVAKLHIRLELPLNAAGWAAQHQALRSLKSVQALLALVGIHSGVAFDAEIGLRTIAEAAGSDVAGWKRALAILRGLKEGNATGLRTCSPDPCSSDPCSPDPCSPDPPSFRASAVRDGQHVYNSMDVAQAMAKEVGRLLGWRPQMVGFEVQAVGILLQHELVMGISLSLEDKGFRRGKMQVEPRPLLPRADVTARLRSSTAYLLLQLAQLQPGDVLLDPMCGVGTLPLEAAATAPMVVALAGDHEALLLAQVGCNAAALHTAQQLASARSLQFLPLSAAAPGREGEGAGERSKSGRVTDVPAWHYDERWYEQVARGSGVLGCTWDAARLPLRPRSVDACVIDLPFGMTHKVRNGRSVQDLYARVTQQAARVLRPGGRLVLLTPSRPTLEFCLAQQRAYWDERQDLRVNCGGALACVSVWLRTHKPYAHPAD